MKNKTASTFDWALARRLLNWSAAAYSLGPFSSDHPTPAIIQDAATGAQVIVTLDADANIIVACKGSSTILDFIQDAKALPHQLEWSLGEMPASVHEGFFQDFNGVNVRVAATVSELLKLNPNVKIYITGHSLGGALAILLALEFSRVKIPVAAVVTFGQPRVGNDAFAQIYNFSLGDRTFHVINANDPVPLLPPLLCGYRDEGNEVFLPHRGRPVLNPSLGFQFISDILGMFDSWRRRKLAFLPNHFLKAYQDRIEFA